MLMVLWLSLDLDLVLFVVINPVMDYTSCVVDDGS